ncbi:MAG TPA: magnesium transporter CorA family protein [Noviherbaspirillum sp.]|nr:magnesium transporter CorA family protein [Noviherbaspirillum sp.]
MEVFHLTGSSVALLSEADASIPANGGFLWIDATREEVAADTPAWRTTVERLTGVRLYEPHLQDILNAAHPSYFDPTHAYAMLVFRKLAIDESAAAEPDTPHRKRRIPPALTRLSTKPVTFMLMDRALVTVRPAHSRTLAAFRTRLLEHKPRPENGLYGMRLPASPPELALRLLNALVDQYLALRDPLTGQIERWQRALLSPRSRFNNWSALLDARLELRKLDQLCEGQRDAVQALRDYLMDEGNGPEDARSRDLLRVRANDVMEHITRVLTHTQRLEAGIESAVQIHFSAMAHRTSEVMRILTVITAIFMPLTLITGVFGMNFEALPLLDHPAGFWISLGMMAATVAVLLALFWRKRYLEDQVVDHER